LNRMPSSPTNPNQLHPWCQQRECVEYCKKNNIVVEAYCPLVRNEKANDKTLVGICEKHNVGPNQVLVRWSLQKGFVPLPKSDTPSRIVSNADVYGFELDSDDMAKLDGLDQGKNGAIVQAVSTE
jgi:diketogulonate reductase-like aldo/keto reductase